MAGALRSVQSMVLSVRAFAEDHDAGEDQGSEAQEQWIRVLASPTSERLPARAHPSPAYILRTRVWTCQPIAMRSLHRFPASRTSGGTLHGCCACVS